MFLRALTQSLNEKYRTWVSMGQFYGEATNLNPISRVCQPAICSSFKKQEVMTNTERRDSFPVMVHQVVGADLVLRTRKTNNRKLVSRLLKNLKDSENWGREAVRRTGKMKGQPGLWCKPVLEATANSDSGPVAEKLSKT